MTCCSFSFWVFAFGRGFADSGGGIRLIVGPFPVNWSSIIVSFWEWLYQAGHEVRGVRAHRCPLLFHGFDAFGIFVG